MKKIIALCLLLFFSCKKEHKHSYYYWRTTFDLDKEERKALEHSSDKLYLRYFDVDKKQGNLKIIAPIKKKEEIIDGKTIVPVVYITNRTFMYLKPESIEILVKKVLSSVDAKTEELGVKDSGEIQIDCDWTTATMMNYFKFLEDIKKLSNKHISITLRLHQVKYKKRTGIPPVDEVALMCYSTSSPLVSSTKNSILDVTTLKDYLSNLNDYPIKNIKVALPIYSWGIVTNHVGRRKIINGLSQKSLENENFEKISNNEIRIKNDGFYFGYYLNKDFRIKIEEISQEQLEDTISFLEGVLEEFHIIYYHLDSKFIKNIKVLL